MTVICHISSATVTVEELTTKSHWFTQKFDLLRAQIKFSNRESLYSLPHAITTTLDNKRY